MLIRAFATSILRAVLLHLLLLFVCGGLLWQHLPRLLPPLANWLLKDTGLTLVTLGMQRQTYPPYLINKIVLRTATHNLLARNIYLQQLSPWRHQWAIDAEMLQISTIKPDSSVDGTSTLTVAEAWQSLSASLGQLNQQGSVSDVEYCAEGCLKGAISWQRSTNKLIVNATESGYGAQLTIHAADDKMVVSMVVDTTIGTTRNAKTDTHEANPKQARFGQRVGQHLPERLSLEAALRSLDNGDLDIQGNLMLGAKRQQLSLTEKPTQPVQLDLQSTLSSLSFAAAVPGDSPLALQALQQRTNYRLNAMVNASWRIEQGETAMTSNSPLAFTLTSNSGDFDLQLTTPVITQVIYPDLNNAEANFSAGIRCQVSVDESAFRDGLLTESLVKCQVPQINLKGGYRDLWFATTVLTNSNVERAAGNWSAAGNARVLINDELQRALSMDSRIQASHTQVHLSSDNARAYQLPLQSLSLKHNLTRDTGELNVTLDTTLSEALKLPPLRTLPHLLAVRGKLTGTTRVFWPQQRKSLAQLRVESRYELHNVDFNYNDYQLSGINLQLALDGWPHMVSPTDALLQISQVDIGLPLTDINTRFAIDMDTESGDTMLTGQALSLDLLGGTASANQWRLDPTTKTGFAQLTLQDLALQQILALERDDFDSSGRMTGSVPVHIQDGIINIQQGQLDAVAPGGYIRYRPDEATRAMLLQSKKTKILLETLSDFQYDNLAVLLSYSPAGNLVANTALRGRNPAFESGREIRFNLSIEQNIGTLLRSLRLSEDVEKKIQDRSQKRQKPMPAIEVKPQ